MSLSMAVSFLISITRSLWTLITVLAFGTTSHHIHRQRRQPVSLYFSKGSVLKLQDKIWEHTEHMCEVLEEHYRDRSIVFGRAVFLGWSNDTLRSSVFGECMDLLGNPQKAMVFDRIFKAFAACYPILRQREWIIPIVMKIPISILFCLFSPLATLMTVHVVNNSQ